MKKLMCAIFVVMVISTNCYASYEQGIKRPQEVVILVMERNNSSMLVAKIENPKLLEYTIQQFIGYTALIITTSALEYQLVLELSQKECMNVKGQGEEQVEGITIYSVLVDIE